jgi:hypothetical protein
LPELHRNAVKPHLAINAGFQPLGRFQHIICRDTILIWSWDDISDE